ncbi:MAG: rod shape-determining protein MreC [Bacteroidetes bacterium]|nr:rod shape-determining protein MreC [Bacteroidota bacterium]
MITNYIKKHTSLALFIFLEIISLVFIFNPTILQKAIFHKANIIFFKINEKIKDALDISQLKEENKQLILENKKLKTKLLNYNNTSKLPDKLEDNNCLKNSIKNQYQLIEAKIINNSIVNSKNYITINKGRNHGIKTNMGVISDSGIVGKVKYVTERYSTITSILHTDLYTSIKIKNNDVIGTLKWNGVNPKIGQILYIPKYAKINLNDEILTSGYNAIFPGNIQIGKIINYDLKNNVLFYDINISFETNFVSLKNVYVIRNNSKKEIKDLENKTEKFYN